MAVYSFPIVTGLTAAALAILFVVLSLYVSAGRGRNKVMLGDGDDDLFRRIRAHANLAENAPIFLILLGLVELSRVHQVTVAIVGPVFVICRISHAIGFSASLAKEPNPFRAIGAIGSILIELILAIELGLTLLPFIARW